MPLTKEEAQRLHQELGELLSKYVETVPFVEQVRMLFPEQYLRILKIYEDGDFVIVMPKSFIDPKDYSKIAAIVREVKGEYVSQGKQSHFRIKKVCQ